MNIIVIVIGIAIVLYLIIGIGIMKLWAHFRWVEDKKREALNGMKRLHGTSNIVSLHKSTRA